MGTVSVWEGGKSSRDGGERWPQNHMHVLQALNCTPKNGENDKFLVMSILSQF